MSWLKEHKWFYWLVVIMALLLGLVGVFVPLLPTTPFLILALWAASRCSPSLAAWIENHPKFGPLISAWQKNRAIPLFAKWLASTMMLLSFLVIWYRGASLVTLVISGVLIGGILAYIFSRPSY